MRDTNLPSRTPASVQAYCLACAREAELPTAPERWWRTVRTFFHPRTTTFRITAVGTVRAKRDLSVSLTDVTAEKLSLVTGIKTPRRVCRLETISRQSRKSRHAVEG